MVESPVGSAISPRTDARSAENFFKSPRTLRLCERISFQEFTKDTGPRTKSYNPPTARSRSMFSPCQFGIAVSELISDLSS